MVVRGCMQRKRLLIVTNSVVLYRARPCSAVSYPAVLSGDRGQTVGREGGTQHEGGRAKVQNGRLANPWAAPAPVRSGNVSANMPTQRVPCRMWQRRPCGGLHAKMLAWLEQRDRHGLPTTTCCLH